MTATSAPSGVHGQEQTAFVFSSTGCGRGALAMRLRVREHQIAADEPDVLGGQA